MQEPSTASSSPAPSLFSDASLWGDPLPELSVKLQGLRDAYAELSRHVTYEDRRDDFAALVTSGENRLAPIHRWFPYKEAFSYRLPRLLLDELGVGNGRVADVFGGVGTSALSLQTTPQVEEIVSVEYSPLAAFVGRTKLAWPDQDASRLRKLAVELREFDICEGVAVPELAAFSNSEIFPAPVARTLASARDAIFLSDLEEHELDFFALGLAAVCEDVSGAKKDGRALRIMRKRSRRPSSLVGSMPNRDEQGVRDALHRQWDAMIDDLMLRRGDGMECSPAQHVEGDARALGAVTLGDVQLLADASIGRFIYSPPYLNMIDYTEVYKVELWLLDFVTMQEEFRNLRLGTLRSHPSVEFPERGYLKQCADKTVVGLVEGLAGFVTEHGSRANVGRAIYGYFDDLFKVLSEQYRVLESGGISCCVVGNSTFSKREEPEDESKSSREAWRLPVLTDVVIAGMATSIGFESVEIWEARELRPRNVRNGTARESIVIMRKPAA